jgi:hypothetical protein
MSERSGEGDHRLQIDSPSLALGIELVWRPLSWKAFARAVGDNRIEQIA